MACLDDNQVQAFVERTLDEATWTVLARHVDQCESCLQLTCAVAATLGDVIATTAGYQHGDRVGRYELLAMIGRGAMGGVYTANDPQLARKVALKIVRTARFGETAVRERLEREAKAMAQITHPNVVAVYDTGTLDDGVFIAMELLAGEELAAKKQATWQETVRLYIAAGHGLAAAHQAGIVHRDFKPQNVMVTDKGRVVVADFGLAVVGSEVGETVGTPRYMSPEHMSGGEVTAKSDQFGFAVALYEALYKTPPFAGNSLPEIRASLAVAVPAKPPNPAVPMRVHAAITRALAIDPQKRWPAIEDLVQELEAALRPSPLKYYAAFAVAVAALVVGAAVVVHSRHEHIAEAPVVAPGESPRVQLAIAPFANRTGDPAFDDSLDMVIATQLARSHQADVIASYELEGAMQAVGGSVADIDKLAPKLNPNLVVVHGSIEKSGETFTLTLDAPLAHPLHLTKDHLTRDEITPAVVELANQLRAALGDPDHEGSAMSKSVDAVHTYTASIHAEIAGEHQKAADLARSAISADAEFVQAYVLLGTILFNAGERQAAGPAMERAIALKDRLGERERYQMLGDYYSVTGRYSEAIAAYQELLARYPGDKNVEGLLVSTAIDGQVWPLALELARNNAKSHPEHPVVRGNLILAELGNERISDAITDGDQMLSEFPQPPDFPSCAVMAAHALAGQPQKAHEVLAGILKRNPDLVTATADLAMFEGKPAEAKAALEPWLAANPPEETKPTRMRLALADRALGDRAGAVKAAQLARDSNNARVDYFTMQVLVEADAANDVADVIAKWTASDVAEWRAVGHVLAGDVAMHRKDSDGALREYMEAEHHQTSWLIHERRWRAYLLRGDRETADKESQWLVTHRGQIAVYLTPSLTLSQPR
ncbi:MAG TPA: protein kinase [Kofleriaceae bacterium]